MRIQVTGQRIDVGEALQARVQSELAGAAGKYARPTDANVVFSRDGHQFACEIFMHLSSGLTAQANGAAPDAHAAFDQALERMSKQLRRHKRRLKDYHLRTQPLATLPAVSAVLAPFAEDAGDEDDVVGLPTDPTGLDADADAAAAVGAPGAAPGGDGAAGAGTEDGAQGGVAAPLVIAEMETRLPTLTVGEAVMQMELAHAPVLVFHNGASGALNVVYRREDGNIGWIDPRPGDGTRSGAAPGEG